MVRESAEILQETEKDEQNSVPVCYYNMERRKEETIISCQGDLVTICNVLADYGDMLNEYLEAEKGRMDFCSVFGYERMRDRCRSISEKLQQKIGYDRQAAIEKCRQKQKKAPKADQGIGEDALVLMARRNAAAKQKAEEAKLQENKK